MRSDLSRATVDHMRKFMTRRHLLSELHHLLWRAPFVNGDQLDAGFMCREHAMLVAGLAKLKGHVGAIVWGHLVLVGDTQDGGHGCFPMYQHSWAGLEGLGLFDLSLNLAAGTGPGWKKWPGEILAANNFYPATTVKVEFYSNEEELLFQQRVKYYIDTGGYAALYHGRSFEEYTSETIANAVEIINSPLTDELRGLPEFTPDIYRQALFHLWEIVHRRRRSLTSLSQLEAWREIARIQLGPQSKTF